MPSAEATVTGLLADVTPLLDERQRRLAAAAGARALGRGGIAAVMRQTGMSRTTIKRGIGELEAGVEPQRGRARAAGGGRKLQIENDPKLVEALDALVDTESRGDPESELRWTCKSTRKPAKVLSDAGHPVGYKLVGELLRDQLGFRLQANAKVSEGKQHPDRDAQFRYINEQARRHLRSGQVVVSIDAKKKELLGQYKAVGREWEPKGRPVKVASHDFPDPEIPRAYLPLRRLRRQGQRGVRLGRSRPRDGGVRRRDAQTLVAQGRPGLLPQGQAPFDLCGRGRLQRLHAPPVEGRTRPPRGADRPSYHRLPPAARHLEVE